MQNVSFWHCLPVYKAVRARVLHPAPRHSTKEFLPAYNWLKDRIGYFPIFLAAGNEVEAPYTTGYHNQWRVALSTRFCSKTGRILTLRRRKPGQFPNMALFRFDEIPEACTYMDSAQWSIGLLYDLLKGENPPESDIRKAFKASWNKNRWMRLAQKDGYAVELVVPQLDLSKASSVWVRNKATKERLEKLGYKNVQVRRIPLEPQSC